MKLKNKILIILIALISCILLNASNCFAYSSYEYESQTLYLPDLPKDLPSNNIILAYEANTGYIALAVAQNDTDIWIYQYNRYYAYDITDGSKSLTYNYYSVKPETSIKEAERHSWSFSSSGTDGCVATSNTIYNSSATSKHIYGSFADYQNDNVLINSSNLSPISGTDPFFQAPSLILAPIVEEVETQETMSQVLAVLPVVLIVIVSLIAMRKAIKELLNLLKRS